MLALEGKLLAAEEPREPLDVLNILVKNRFELIPKLDHRLNSKPLQVLSTELCEFSACSVEVGQNDDLFKANQAFEEIQQGFAAA